MDIRFKQIYDPFTNAVSTTAILYFDENGAQWTVPMGTGHRFEALYDEWVAEGHTIEPADFPAKPAE